MSRSDAQPLTVEILDRFGETLRHAGAPLGNEIQPGLSDGEIDAIGAELGVAVPSELRTLWRWGTAPSEPRLEDSWDINYRLELWPPSYAVSRTKEHRRDEFVSQTTIAFGGPANRGWFLVEGGALHATSPVIYRLIDDPDPGSAAPSLGTLVEYWARQLAERAYYYDGERWYPDDGPRPWPGG